MCLDQSSHPSRSGTVDYAGASLQSMLGVYEFDEDPLEKTSEGDLQTGGIHSENDRLRRIRHSNSSGDLFFPSHSNQSMPI